MSRHLIVSNKAPRPSRFSLKIFTFRDESLFHNNPMNILKKIVAQKEKEIATKKNQPYKNLTPSERDFKSTITKTRKNDATRIIAEIKKASPSGGILRASLESEIKKIVAIYNRHAAAISVVTDEKFFQGSFTLLESVRKETNLPILCKDFIIHPSQIKRARNAGADAILLLATLLDKKTLTLFIQEAREINMDALVEVHTREEIQTALSARAKIIGINNRDLRTFQTDINTTRTLVGHIPNAVVTVSESGFASKKDVQKVGSSVDAVLIGTALMKSNDIEKTLCAFQG